MKIKDLFYNGMMSGQIVPVTQMPEYFETGINPEKHLRPYQVECMKQFLTYMENDFDGKQSHPHLLFHMATGSGKTMQMALSMLYLYDKGYRNFLFFVGNNNILEKTKDNFLNPTSSKYLFAPSVNINGKHVEVKEVQNFQGTSDDCINFCLKSIQGLHSDLNTEKENAITYEDFSSQPIVLIADEAHHLNAGTRNGTLEEDYNWEATVNRIFNHDNGILSNVLLEFTATMDLTNPAIAQKYEDKIIFNYTLKSFREDGYSKDVETIETDLGNLDRALQAMLLSQYKRKLFGELRLNIKPVVLLKSKTKKDNKAIYEAFIKSIHEFTSTNLDLIRQRASGDLACAFEYFQNHNISDNNVILELQEDFSEERILLVDGDNISPEKQRILNSLEDESNEIRAIFAVDMLNEGWDVLNLYDIVRLYDTRDAKDDKPGKTTMQEAQLIGRGARYMPFTDPNNATYPIDKRKYDGDAANPYKVIEKLHYHSAHNPRYIQELRQAMIITGIIADHRQQLDLFMKPGFKESHLYQKGIVFVNEQKRYAEVEDDGTIGADILKKIFKIKMFTGKMSSGQIFGDNAPSDVLTSLTISPFAFIEIGKHVIRSAMNAYTTFNYNSLHQLYLQLKSCQEFVESDSYLAKLKVTVTGKYQTLAEYSQTDKLYIAKEVLKQLEPLLLTRGKMHRGSQLFVPKDFKTVFRDKIVLNVNIPVGSAQELGRPQKNSLNPEYTLDLWGKDWYAYNENYGTSEEKALVKYVDSIMPKLKEKYDEVYLVRNEKDVKIYSFEEGRPFEPDFILFLRVKGINNKYDNLQIFIEPKGDQLLLKDKWKDDFLRQIADTGEITWLTSSDNFNIWGLPFFNEGKQIEFTDAFESTLLNNLNEEMLNSKIQVLDSLNVEQEKKYTIYLPLYSIRAVCGYFGEGEPVEEEGWIKAEGIGRLNEKMFVVRAVGHSMEPRINDGDYCVFQANPAGSRQGKIVLAQHRGYVDEENAGAYSIKEYSSEKSFNEDGYWQHEKIVLKPYNRDYDPIELTPDDIDDFRVVGEFIGIIRPEEPQKEEKMICPECGGELVERKGPYGAFYGCSNYPQCHYMKKK